MSIFKAPIAVFVSADVLSIMAILFVIWQVLKLSVVTLQDAESNHRMVLHSKARSPVMLFADYGNHLT